MDGRQLVLDVRNGRHLVVPTATPVLGRLPMTADARAELAGRQLPADAHAGAGATVPNPLLPRTVAPPANARAQAQAQAGPGPDGSGPWDPKMAGTRQSVFYPPTHVTHGPGTVTT